MQSRQEKDMKKTFLSSHIFRCNQNVSRFSNGLFPVKGNVERTCLFLSRRKESNDWSCLKERITSKKTHQSNCLDDFFVLHAIQYRVTLHSSTVKRLQMQDMYMSRHWTAWTCISAFPSTSVLFFGRSIVVVHQDFSKRLKEVERTCLSLSQDERLWQDYDKSLFAFWMKHQLDKKEGFPLDIFLRLCVCVFYRIGSSQQRDLKGIYRKRISSDSILVELYFSRGFPLKRISSSTQLNGSCAFPFQSTLRLVLLSLLLFYLLFFRSFQEDDLFGLVVPCPCHVSWR